MFNSQFVHHNSNSYSQKSHSLPIYSHYKPKKQYQTPFKSLVTTNNTNNVTLSMYSFKSKSKSKTNQYCKSINNKPRKANFSHATIKNNKKRSQKARPKSSKNAIQRERQLKSHFKPNPASDLQQEKKERSVKTNKQFYKHIRQSTHSQSTSVFLSKISDIFDLVTLSIALPAEVQTFLARPLNELRGTLYRNGRTQMSTTLTQFKNGCMNIYRIAPSSEITLFNRIKLPASNRWSSSGHSSRFQREQQMRRRQQYYYNLKSKLMNDNNTDSATLNRIQNRLDQFLQKSLKYRKVFI